MNHRAELHRCSSARVAELAGMRSAGRLRRGHADAHRGEDTLVFDLVPEDLTRTPPG